MLSNANQTYVLAEPGGVAHEAVISDVYLKSHVHTYIEHHEPWCQHVHARSKGSFP